MTEYNCAKVLEALLPTIYKIDGECSYCIREFVERANKGLSAAGLQARFVIDPNSPRFEPRVTVEGLAGAEGD